jgi:ABC-type Fe3+ transport system permease subunit
LIRGRAARWPATYLLKEEHRMADSLTSNLTRRTFLKRAGVATAAAVGLTIIVRSARAKSDTLKIGQWPHFVPWVAPISMGTIGWRWMLDSLYSPVNWVLQALHMGFFKSIPKDIEEAAMVDGCSRARAIVQIIMPISLAGILSAVIFAFTLTVGVGVPTNLGRGDIYFWGSLAAACLITSIPVAILYNLSLDRFISGFTVGAIK